MDRPHTAKTSAQLTLIVDDQNDFCRERAQADQLDEDAFADAWRGALPLALPPLGLGLALCVGMGSWSCCDLGTGLLLRCSCPKSCTVL